MATLPFFAQIALIVGGIIAPINAGDFVLVADIDNATIFMGTLALRLTDMTPLPLIGLVTPVSVDFDPVEAMVYWTDPTSFPSPAISRAHLNGSGQTRLVEDLRYPIGLALHVESGVMFWTDGKLGHVARAPMNGTEPEEIIVDRLDRPRGIVTDHQHRHIYWTDVGSNPHIERADFDGRNRRTIIEGDLHWPNGVTIDFDGNKLYWCDGFLDTIERSDLSGDNRELVVNLTSYNGLTPFDLAVYESNVYWTDWGNHKVLRVHVNGRAEQAFGPGTFQKAGGIHIQKERNYCDSRPCLNGATCVDATGGFVCHCPRDFHGVTCNQRMEARHSGILLPVLVVVLPSVGGAALLVVVVTIVICTIKRQRARTSRTGMVPNPNTSEDDQSNPYMSIIYENRIKPVYVQPVY